MTIAKLSSKNQIVLPKEVRKKIKGLKPGKKVLVYPLSNTSVAIKVEEKSWTQATSGIMKNAWKGIDTTKYLNNLPVS